MSEPASREDIEKAKRDIIESIVKMDQSVENMRSQNSAEHGSIFAKLGYVHEAALWIKAQWVRFMRLPDEPSDRH